MPLSQQSISSYAASNLCRSNCWQNATALERQDFPGVRKWAHTLKGSLGYLGAMQASALAQQLERLATDGNVAGCRAVFDELRAALDRLTAEMQTTASVAAG